MQSMKILKSFDFYKLIFFFPFLSDMEDLNVLLIRLVHMYPCIYDKTIKEYRDNVLNQKAWEDIVNIFNERTGCKLKGK